MKKFISAIICSGALLTGGAFLTGCASAEAAQEEYVYVCTGPNAKVYHTTPYCSGLNKCSGEVKKIRRSETKRRACKKC